MSDFEALTSSHEASRRIRDADRDWRDRAFLRHPGGTRPVEHAVATIPVEQPKTGKSRRPVGCKHQTPRRDSQTNLVVLRVAAPRVPTVYVRITHP